MDSNTVTLFIGLAGIGSTLIIAGVGFYFNYKTRKSSYQEILFSEQLNLIKNSQLEIGYIKHLMPILTNLYNDYVPEADLKARQHLVNLSNLANEGSAIFPAELWLEHNKLVNEVQEFLDTEPRSRTKDMVTGVGAQAAVFSIANRRVLGADELSMETYKVISNSKEDRLMPEGGKEILLEEYLSKSSNKELNRTS